jgi:hypothetical protein
MNAPPCVEQNNEMFGDEPQSPPRTWLGAGIGLAQFNPDQVCHLFPLGAAPIHPHSV